jgi:hypothetical protein
MKNFGLQHSISIGVDRMQRNFEPMRRQVEAWRASQLSDEAAKRLDLTKRLKPRPSEPREGTATQKIKTAVHDWPHGQASVPSQE